MIRRRSGRQPAVSALVLALVVSGCGSDDGGSSSGGEQTLASFMGWEDESMDDADMEAEWRDQEAQIQESIRDCMADQGFEYLPVDHSQGSFVIHEEGTDEEERIRTQGFGITTWYGNDEMVDDAMDEGAEWHDPNQEIVEAMSDSEREAYYEALHGDPDEMMGELEIDPETGEEYYTSTGWGSGCDGQAYEEAYGSQDETQELWEELQPAFDQMYERVQADERIVEWNERWSRCMAEAGHDYESPESLHNEIWDDFDRRMQEIMGPGGGFADPFEGWSESEIEAFFEERTDDEIEAFFDEAQSQQADNIDHDALAALQQEEIDLAVADFECRDGDELWEIHQQVQEEYEADFIAENRELLEQIREAEGR